MAAWVGALLALLTAGAAAPAAGQTRVAVRPFEGPMSVRAHDAVEGSLADADYQIVSNEELERAADATGGDLSRAAGRTSVAREVGVAAIVEGVVSKRGNNFTVQLTVYDGASGRSLGDAEIKAKKPALVRAVRRQAAGELADALGRAQAPPGSGPSAAKEPEPEPEPEPVEEPPPVRRTPEAKEGEEDDGQEGEGEEPEPEAEEPEPDDGTRPDALELDVGLKLVTRSMKYNDAPRGLGESSLDVTPAAALGLRWYPGAHFGNGAGAHVGLEAGLQLMYPVTSARMKEEFKTSSLAFGAGLHGRLPLGDHELGLTIGYGQHAVEIADSDSGADPGVPSVKYGFLRFALNGRFQLGDALALRFLGGYRLLLGYGELAEDAWFQRTGGGGIEAEIAPSYQLSDAFAIEASFGLWRYFMSLEPEPTDDSVTDFARIAGGLTDQYLRFGLGIVLTL